MYLKQISKAVCAFLFAISLLPSSVMAEDGWTYDENTKTYSVTTAAGIEAAINSINSADSGSYTISVANDIDCSSGPAMSFKKNTTTIIGNGHTLNFGSLVYPITVDDSSFTPELILGSSNDAANTLTLLSSANTGDDGHFIRVGVATSSGKLTMNDGVTVSGYTSTHSIGVGVEVNPGSQFIMNGGTISDCHVKNGSCCLGGGVAVLGGALFTMNGGTISNCSASTTRQTGYGFRYDQGCGGGVFVGDGSTFIMNGGSITGCAASNYGGGVALASSGNNGLGYLDSRFEMTGGSITYNEALIGGGIAVLGSYPYEMDPIGAPASPVGKPSAPGLFVSGGSISYNSAANGGGIFGCQVRSGAPLKVENATLTGNDAGEGGAVCVMSYWTQLTLNNCTINNNTAEANGAGISITGNSSGGKTVIKDTAVTGNTITDGDNDISNRGAGIYYDASSRIEISGAMTVQSNTYNGTPNNLNIYSASAPVYVTGPLTGSSIGVSDPTLWEDGKTDADPTAASTPKLTSGYASSNSGVNPSAYFMSDHNTWHADYSEDGTEVRLVRDKMYVIVLPVAESEELPGAYSDAGYYGVDEGQTSDASALGVIRFSTYVENPLRSSISEIGTVLTNGSKSVTKTFEYPSGLDLYSFTFSVDVKDIPASFWSTPVTAQSYVKYESGETQSLNTQSICVNDNLKWLGAEMYGSKVYTNTDADKDIVDSIKGTEGN